MAELQLPNTIAAAAKNLSSEQRALLLQKYRDGAKSKGLNWFLWLIGFQHFYQGKIGMGLLFLCTLPLGIGFVWWIFEAFRNNKEIDKLNDQLAMELFTEQKLLASD
ncbi:TM2 domain-containing protein [Vibrio phage vB_VpaS_MAR10]|uniref:TM2 domain-containing protein n=1 Tax=Vibrio phage vB_VpaS_MAR10 TaxID=1229755 RepID=K7RVT7_9CAUD|nr:TM2 domain-containing protein [Vibrio phage vB_VpaS_MAR10]AFV81325.1 hypothetical protein MAR10_089 [Vibrio phage vB_VpaS_MAR10]AXH68385.1 hypothetical protein [Vibrio phage R01]